MKRYTFKAALDVIARELDVDDHKKFIEHTNPRHLHVWIGERHLAETNRLPLSGPLEFYTEKDLRRAIAFGRFQSICGAGIGKEAAAVRERIREVASWHTYGAVLVTDFYVSWTDRELRYDSILESKSFAVIPCTVESLG